MKRLKRIALFMAAALVTAAAAIGWLVFDRPSVPEPSGQLLTETAGLDEIAITVRLNAEKASLSVNQTLRLTNRTGEKQDAVVLRTWANAFQSMDTSPCAAEDKLYELYYPDGFSSGGLVMSHATVDGSTVLYRYTDEAKTVLHVPVPGGWQPDAETEIMLTYTIQMPRMAYRFGLWDDIWALGNAFAVPAVWENGAFRTDAYASVGDPFVNDCANYLVTAIVPEDYVCAGSASPYVSTSDGQSHYVFYANGVREFGLVISDRFHTAQTMQDGVLVTAFAASRSQARELLRYGRRALKCYSEAYGAYAYPSYTLAQVNFPHGGMEYPGMSMIASSLLEEGGRELEYTVAHETAHQWWYAVVGSDSWNQPWQDEALCEFSLLRYAQENYGQAERDDLERSRMESSLRVTVPHGVTPGAPLNYFSSMSEYKLLVYDRAAACLCAMDRTVPLDGFLRDYYRHYAFRRASREDFEQQLLQSTGEDLSPLMRDYLDTYILN